MAMRSARAAYEKDFGESDDASVPLSPVVAIEAATASPESL